MSGPEGGRALAPVSEWRVHLGAHKTATTHLQETLNRIRPALLEKGVDAIPNEQVRETGFAAALKALPRGPDAGERALALLAPLRRGPGRLVISEENLLGEPVGLIRAEPYPRAHDNAQALRALAAAAPLTLFLSIRSLDEAMPAGYAQTLRHGPGEGFAQARARAVAEPPSWLPAIRGIRSAVPGAVLRVWSYHDYRRRRAAIIAELCGTDPGPLPRLKAPDSTRSPSAAAVEAAEALPADLPAAERRARADALYAASIAAGEPKWRPFSEDERALLRARFRRDLRRLEAAMPGVLMRFDAAEA